MFEKKNKNAKEALKKRKTLRRSWRVRKRRRLKEAMRCDEHFKYRERIKMVDDTDQRIKSNVHNLFEREID